MFLGIRVYKPRSKTFFSFVAFRIKTTSKGRLSRCFKRAYGRNQDRHRRTYHETPRKFSNLFIFFNFKYSPLQSRRFRDLVILWIQCLLACPLQKQLVSFYIFYIYSYQHLYSTRPFPFNTNIRTAISSVEHSKSFKLLEKVIFVFIVLNKISLNLYPEFGLLLISAIWTLNITKFLVDGNDLQPSSSTDFSGQGKSITFDSRSLQNNFSQLSRLPRQLSSWQ
jgi:hypothetical protein